MINGWVAAPSDLGCNRLDPTEGYKKEKSVFKEVVTALNAGQIYTTHSSDPFKLKLIQPRLMY